MTAPPECPTCHPRWAPSPSGGTWFHRRPCHDGAQIGGYQRARTNHPAQGWRKPLQGLRIVEEKRQRSIALRTRDAEHCPAHPSEPLYECVPCNEMGEAG